MNIENVMYKVEYHDGKIEKIDKMSLQEIVEQENYYDFSSVIKTYRFNGKLHRLTLFSVEHDFTADEYINHYKTLPDKYGKHFLSSFDEILIRKLNY